MNEMLCEEINKCWTATNASYDYILAVLRGGEVEVICWTNCYTCVHVTDCERHEKMDRFCQEIRDLTKEYVSTDDNPLDVDVIMRCKRHKMPDKKEETNVQGKDRPGGYLGSSC